MKYLNATILKGLDNANVNGAQIDSSQLASASFHVVPGNATDTGALKIQISNDLNTNASQVQEFVVANWVDLPSATATITSGGQAIITVSNMAYRWVRAVYTFSSGGSGSTNMIVNMFAISI